MQCKTCGKKLQIAHLCPYCHQYYCKEHYKPQKHNCQNNPQKETIKNQQTESKLTKITKNFFPPLLTLVIIDEILRQISYTKNTPYLEPNIYILITSQWINPYIASSIIFLATCLTLFTLNKLSSKWNKNPEQNKNFIKKIIPIGIYTTIATIYIPSIIQWIIITST